MVGALHPTPIATLPFLAPHSAVVPFCEGLYQHVTAWDALKEDASNPIAKCNGEVTLEQVKEKLRSVLSLTDVTKFPVPKNPNAVIFVAATVSFFFFSFYNDSFANLTCIGGLVNAP